MIRWAFADGQYGASRPSALLSSRSLQEGLATSLSSAWGYRPNPLKGTCPRGPMNWGLGLHRQCNPSHIFLYWMAKP